MRWFLIVVVWLSISGRYANAEVETKSNGYFETVAVPVKTADVRSIWAGPDAEGNFGKSIYLFTFPPSENQYLWMLRIDPDTGMCESFYTGAPMRRPRATQNPSAPYDGWLYGDWDTMAYRFNPKTGILQELEKVGLRWNFKTGQAEKKEPDPDPILAKAGAPDGKEYTQRSTTSNTLWVTESTATLAHLWVYDPKTGEEKDLGIVPERKWWQYPQGPSVGPNGKLYFSLAIAEPDIVMYDAETGEQKSILPMEYRKFPAWNIGGTDSKGNIYWFLYGCKPGLEPRQAFRVEDETLVPIPLEEFPGYTGEGFPWTPPEPPSTTLADGRKVSFIQIEGSPGYYGFEDRALKISDPKTGKERILHYDYTAPGRMLFGKLGKDPDGRIYGMANRQLYRYDPRTGKSEELGMAPCYNQVYASIFYKGKFFTMSYGGGLLAVYDPTKPWRYGKDKDANPQDLGFVGGPGGDRFASILVGPDEKIYAVSNPINGYLGGSIICLDPKTLESKYWWNQVTPKHNLGSLTLDTNKKGLWVGSSPMSVSSGDTDPADTSARLSLWDLTAEKSVFTCMPIPDMLAITTLVTAPNGLIYGLGRLGTYKGTQPHWGGGVMFVFDPQKREVVHENRKFTPFVDFGHTMELGSDGLIYAIVDQGICVINPEDYSMELLAKWQYGTRTGILMDGKNIYFTSGANLVRYSLP